MLAVAATSAPGASNSEPCVTAPPVSRGADDDAFEGRWRGNVVEDPLAAVALDDAVVLPHQLEDLRPQAHVAHRAETITGGRRHRDALAHARDLFEDPYQPGIQIR